MKRAITAMALLNVLLIGCNAGPDTPKPTKQTTTRAGTSYIKTANSASTKDQQYVEQLRLLERRNPQLEAQQAIASGKPGMIGYYSGRAGLKAPGVTAKQQAQQRCKVDTIDGLGDVIYGENHLKYRIAMRNFIKSYNSTMLSACL